MRYPDFIKIGDTIGITAPSAGITKKEDWLRLDNVKIILEVWDIK